MSKGDAQRAMREARYHQNQADAAARRAVAPAAAPSADTAKPPAATPKAAKPAAAAGAAAAAAASSGRCGHKSMNGRECTREAGHPEKSHRYG